MIKNLIRKIWGTSSEPSSVSLEPTPMPIAPVPIPSGSIDIGSIPKLDIQGAFFLRGDIKRFLDVMNENQLIWSVLGQQHGGPDNLRSIVIINGQGPAL